MQDVYDTALVISGDSDLCPAIRGLKRVCPVKRVIAVFPPERRSDELRKVTDGVLRINDAIVRQAQLPASVVTNTGISLKRPNYWT